MKITRRDFVNGVLAGSGAALLNPGVAYSAIARNLNRVDDSWYGFGGVGDYAPSHGNTPEVVNTAHRLRDGEFASLSASLPIDEEYDLVIVGGGMAGLGAAWHFKKNARPGQKCLMLDNHPLFGGEAKENEFEVNNYANLMLDEIAHELRRSQYLFYETRLGRTNIRTSNSKLIVDLNILRGGTNLFC